MNVNFVYFVVVFVLLKNRICLSISFVFQWVFIISCLIVNKNTSENCKSFQIKMEKKTHSNISKPIAPPAGLQSIINQCLKIYPDQPNPLQVCTVVKYWLVFMCCLHFTWKKTFCHLFN